MNSVGMEYSGSLARRTGSEWGGVYTSVLTQNRHHGNQYEHGKPHHWCHDVDTVDKLHMRAKLRGAYLLHVHLDLRDLPSGTPINMC